MNACCLYQALGVSTRALNCAAVSVCAQLCEPQNNLNITLHVPDSRTRVTSCRDAGVWASGVGVGRS